MISLQETASQPEASQISGARLSADSIAAKLASILSEVIGATVSAEEPLMEVCHYGTAIPDSRCHSSWSL